MVKKAREVLAIREAQSNKRNKMLSSFDGQLKGLLNVPPPKKDGNEA